MAVRRGTRSEAEPAVERQAVANAAHAGQAARDDPSLQAKGTSVSLHPPAVRLDTPASAPDSAAPVLLTTEQLAHRWQVHPGSLANDRMNRLGCPFVRLGSRVRYRLSDIESFERASLVAGVGAA